MPEQQDNTIQNTSGSSFIGLQSYTEEQAKFFFGRDVEISDLTSLVKANTLTIVFGKSGTGKTSLLNAGVFPKLRKDYCLPFRIRLEFKDDSPDLITQVKNVLKTEIDKYGFRVENYPSNETLWEYFHKEPLWKSITPILVFDQFEEMFTIAKSKPRYSGDEIRNFWEELSNLIENRIPESLNDQFQNHRDQVTYDYRRQPVKVIFAFREEFLPEFESIPTKIPSIKYSRFRLMPMNEEQAYEVITKTWGNKIDDKQARRIITYLTSDTALTSLTVIEPSLLSQVCSYLDKNRIAEGSDKISAAFLDKYNKDTILRSIYDETLTESNDAVKNADPGLNKNAKPVNAFVEDNLITNEGFRNKYSLKDADHKILPGIEILKNKYFIRDDGKAIELTHDVLAPLIKDDREKRRKEMAIRKTLLFALLFIAGISAIIFLGITWASFKKKQQLEDQIKTDSLVLKKVNDSIFNARNGKGISGTGPLVPPPPQNITDSFHIIDSLNEQIKKFQNNEAILIDSITLLKAQIVQLKLDFINAYEKDSVLQVRIDKLTRDNIDLVSDTVNLRNKIIILNNQLAALRQRNSDLYKLYQECLKMCPAPPIPPVPVPPCDLVQSDSNRVKLNLAYQLPENTKSTKKVKIPDNLIIYLIPDSVPNKRIIQRASVYEIRCDQMDLQKAIHYQIAQYCGGEYSFYDVPPGKYFIKICAYYGDFKMYTKKTTGMDVVHLEISPPIR